MPENRRCSAITRSGGKCSASAQEGRQWCWNHDPERAEERRKNASAGGHARSRREPTEISAIKAQVETISSALLRGGLGGTREKPTLDKATAAVLGQLFNVRLRAIELERRLDDQRRLEEEVAELRRQAEEIKRRRGWS